MKIIILTVSLFTALIQFSFAGGNTSVVDLDKVISIKIEEHKITIVGSGMIRKRVASDAEHGDASVFGQPAQMLHAKAVDCTFVIVPYHVNDKLEGVPGPSPRNMTDEMKAQSMKWWKGTLETAKKVKEGEALTIGYQREQMTFTSYFVSQIKGSGSLILPKIDEQK
ncbi:MAG: hypothetical protein ABF379_07240 [Akkermansiaceae bacterium]